MLVVLWIFLQGHKGGFTETIFMGNGTKLWTVADRIHANHTGWSGVDCKTCKRETTKAQYKYSMRFFKKPLCMSCQSLELYVSKRSS